MNIKYVDIFSYSIQSANPIFTKKRQDATVKNREKIGLVRSILSHKLLQEFKMIYDNAR